MARSSPYRIELSVEQERELSRRAAAYSGPWRDVVRRRSYSQPKGLSNAAIAERLVSRVKSVSEWRKRFFEERMPGLDERGKLRPDAAPARCRLEHEVQFVRAWD